LTIVSFQKIEEDRANGIVKTPPTTDSKPVADADGAMTIDLGKTLNILGQTEVSGRRLSINWDGRRSLQSDSSATSFNLDVNDFMSFELIRGENSAPEKKLRYKARLGNFSGSKLKI